MDQDASKGRPDDIRQDELARNFYIILMGEVRVVTRQGDQEVELALLGPGEFFGEMALLPGVRRNASVRAVTPVDLLAMNESDLPTLAASSTAFGDLLAVLIRLRGQANESSGAQEPPRRCRRPAAVGPDRRRGIRYPGLPRSDRPGHEPDRS